jgi:pimeloyl-ACP methyl ester carboxylesterase
LIPATTVWSERVGGLVSINGITSRTSRIRDARNRQQANSVIGTNGISTPSAVGRGSWSIEDRYADSCGKLWSPNHLFADADYAMTAASFDNSDFVDVVIQSYRHRYGNAPGDPAYDASEAKLAAQPPITVPTIVLHSEADGVGPAAGSEGHARHFHGLASAAPHPGSRSFPAARGTRGACSLPLSASPASRRPPERGDIHPSG